MSEIKYETMILPCPITLGAAKDLYANMGKQGWRMVGIQEFQEYRGAILQRKQPDDLVCREYPLGTTSQNSDTK